MRSLRPLALACVLFVTPSQLLAQPKAGPPAREKTQAEKDADARAKEISREAGVAGAGISFAFILAWGIFALTIGLGPLWLALLRKHPNTAAIAAVNILLGWTCLGWIVALVWALTAFDRPLDRRYRRPRDDYDD